jgi:ribonuclease BN (tRNA processing enzyme)
MQHSVPAFGLQATNNGRTIAYSGDTGPCPALIDLASGTDLFVCEAGAATPERAHCTVTDALSAAEQGSSRRLLLTHLGEGVDTTRLSAQADGPPVAIAVPGMKIVLDE